MTTVAPARSELAAERAMTPDEIWTAAERRLDRPLAEGLNTAHEACDRWARDRARLAMIVYEPDGRSTRWTFADLAEASNRLATAFLAGGLRPGDRVAALCTQQIEAYIAALAAWRAGLIYVPLFVGFGPDALADRIHRAGASAVVVDRRHRDTLETTRGLLEGDPTIYTVTGRDGRGLRVGDRSFWAELDRHAPATPMAMTAPTDPATLIYTSGTTGPAKGCLLPHTALLCLQPFVRHTFALGPGDMLFTGANPGWTYGLYTTGVGVMALGHPRVIYTGDFDAATWLRIWAEERVTYVAAAPSAYRKIAQAARRAGGLPPNLRGATSAGEPLDAPLVEAWRALGAGDIQDGYGQSEAGMPLANLADSDRGIVPGALSSVVPGFEVGLVDEDGTPQAEQGIIALHRPRHQASNGYWNQPEKWQARWRGDWFLTGDLGRRDDEGRWWFVGRDDDLIVTSGYNVGPTEVETILLERPGVAEVAVVAAPDPARGSVVRAVVVADGSVGQDTLREDLQSAVRARLGRHAYPRIVEFVDALPRTETGKVRRNALRDAYLSRQA